MSYLLSLRPKCHTIVLPHIRSAILHRSQSSAALLFAISLSLPHVGVLVGRWLAAKRNEDDQIKGSRLPSDIGCMQAESRNRRIRINKRQVQSAKEYLALGHKHTVTAHAIHLLLHLGCDRAQDIFPVRFARRRIKVLRVRFSQYFSDPPLVYSGGTPVELKTTAGLQGERFKIIAGKVQPRRCRRSAWFFGEGT